MITINYLYLLIPDLIFLIWSIVWLKNNAKKANNKSNDTFIISYSLLFALTFFNFIFLIFEVASHIKITY